MSKGIHFLALSGLLACSASFAAQVYTEGAYRYHVTDFMVGSMLPKNVISGPLPFDSTYAALTTEQKAVLFSDYEHLSPGDEPPFPMYGIHHVVKPLLSFAEMYNPVGPLVASVEVDSKGQPAAVTVYQSPDPELTRLVSGALNLERYKPASCQGQPCRMQFVLRLNFPDRRSLPVTNLELQRGERNIGAVFTH